MGSTSPTGRASAAGRTPEARAHALALVSILLTPVPIAVWMLFSQATYFGFMAYHYLGFYSVWNIIFAVSAVATVSAIVAGGMAIVRLARYPAQVGRFAWMGVALIGIAIATLDGAAIALFIYLIYGMSCPAGC